MLKLPYKVVREGVSETGNKHWTTPYDGVHYGSTRFVTKSIDIRQKFWGSKTSFPTDSELHIAQAYSSVGLHLHIKRTFSNSIYKYIFALMKLYENSVRKSSGIDDFIKGIV